jgi:hypothetical protein
VQGTEFGNAVLHDPPVWTRITYQLAVHRSTDQRIDAIAANRLYRHGHRSNVIEPGMLSVALAQLVILVAIGSAIWLSPRQVSRSPDLAWHTSAAVPESGAGIAPAACSLIDELAQKVLVRAGRKHLTLGHMHIRVIDADTEVGSVESLLDQA